QPREASGRRLPVARTAGMIGALCVSSSPTGLRRLTALATRGRRKRPILGKAAMLWLYGPTAFAAGLGRQCTILGKTALLMRHVGTALAGNFTLFVLLHAGETTQRSSALALMLVSHAVTSCLCCDLTRECQVNRLAALGVPAISERRLRQFG